MTQTNYEELTVPELKDLAEVRGIPVAYDARKAEIIAALESSDVLLRPPDPEPKSETEPDQPEGKSENVYEFQMNSTVSALCVHDDYWKLKLTA